MLSNLFGSLDVPHELHCYTKPASCIETAVAPGDGARVASHKMRDRCAEIKAAALESRTDDV